MTANEVIKIAIAEEGYLEKISNRDLDSKTGNAGYNNFTKYARDYRAMSGIDVQGQPWCDVFVDWCFCKAFGVEAARKLLGGFSAYTPTSANYFRNMGRWHTKDPRPGDVIFFHNSTRICHTGLVERVDGSCVYTIEGNTSGAATVVSNGGGVHRKKYALNNPRISGYGRPAYEDVRKTPSNDPETHSEQTKVSDSGHVPLNYRVGSVYTLQQDMNVRTKRAVQDPGAIPSGEVIGSRPKGAKVTCQATTLVNGKIWMYVGLDAGRRECWICADNGRKAYIK